MKISGMTLQDVRERMGSDASDSEVAEMFKMLVNSPFENTDEISDEIWQRMIRKAVANTD